MGHKNLLRRMFWASEKGIFQIFANPWVMKLKPFSGKVRQSFQNYLNKSLVIGSFLENGLEANWAQKRMFWAVQKSIFQFFQNFWVTKLKPFSGKVRQSIQNSLNKNLVIRKFLGNGFEATLRWKTNVLIAWKEHFPVFCKFLSD